MPCRDRTVLGARLNTLIIRMLILKNEPCLGRFDHVKGTWTACLRVWGAAVSLYRLQLCNIGYTRKPCKRAARDWYPNTTCTFQQGPCHASTKQVRVQWDKYPVPLYQACKCHHWFDRDRAGPGELNALPYHAQSSKLHLSFAHPVALLR